MKAKGGYVYIVSNKHRTVYYIGVTSNLYHRAYQHKNAEGSSFTKRYNCTDLIYYEFFQSIQEAIAREKKLKRAWKEELVKELNPAMKDLFHDIQEMQ